MSELELLKDSIQDRIISMPSVNGIGVGMKWVNGQPTNKPAILVFVQSKMPKDGVISKYSVQEVIPKKIDGITTDVVEVGYIKKQGLTAEVRPIKPGYSCGHGDITCGTIGGIFIDRDGDPVILSNNHVLANENKASVGDPIYQPGPADTTGDISFKGWDDTPAQLPYFATLKNFVQLQSSGNTQDTAIAKIHNKFMESGMVDYMYPVINKQLSGVGSAKVGMQVQKLGRTTGYTTGRVIATNASFTVGYDFGEARFNNCVVCSAMSKGGDSGSIIMDTNMNAIALLFAGSNKVTLGTPMQPIINQYGLSLLNADSGITPTFELDDGKWSIIKSVGTITQGVDSITINSPANCYCYFQRNLRSFKSIRVTVNTGTDKGATWGPGICVSWPNGTLKLNLRSSGSFSGAVNGNETMGIGKVEPSKDYMLRIRKTSKSYLGEIRDANRWYKVIEIPTSIFPSVPLSLSIGKTNMVGGPGDYSDQGETGQCTFRDLDVR